MRAIFTTVLTLLIFSLWAGFALLIVNPYFRNDLPGYTIGRICIWEGVALLVAGGIAFWITRHWGIPNIEANRNSTRMVMNANYGYLFLGYLVLAIAVAIWQFWLFSLKF